MLNHSSFIINIINIVTNLNFVNLIGMKSFPVGGDNACLHLSLFCLTQSEQESTQQLPVCLTVPVTPEETELCCPTSYGHVHESYDVMIEWRHTSCCCRGQTGCTTRACLGGVLCDNWVITTHGQTADCHGMFAQIRLT